jgi:hypothetical protein
VAVHAAGGVGLTRGGFFLLFAIVWLISFSLAWRFVSNNFPFKM